MKKFVSIACILSLTILTLDAQVVEVLGKLKVTEMDTLNSENMLVVKKSDGTLATRMSSSLPPAPDTMRSFQSDLLLTASICNCSGLPPAMIQSALDFGYSVQDLIGFEVPLQDLLDGGITIQELLNEGLTIQYLLNGGLAIQDLLDGGQTPMNLFNGGVALDSLYGKTYGGGFIFYLTANAGAGLVAAPPFWNGINNPDPTQISYGCQGNNIPGAEGTAIGTGAQNTLDILAGCGTSGIAADICSNLVLNGFADWFLPSKDESTEMYLKVGQGAAGPNQNIAGFENGLYWTSSEINWTWSWIHDFNNNLQNQDDKDIWYRVRPVRAF